MKETPEEQVPSRLRYHLVMFVGLTLSGLAGFAAYHFGSHGFDSKSPTLLGDCLLVLAIIIWFISMYLTIDESGKWLVWHSKEQSD